MYDITLDLVNELAETFDWKVKNLFEVGQLIYILRSNDEFTMADDLEAWKDRMEKAVHAEWSYPKELA